MSTVKKTMMIMVCILTIISLIGLIYLSLSFIISTGNEELLQRRVDGLNKPTMPLGEVKTYLMSIITIIYVFVLASLIYISLNIKYYNSRSNKAINNSLNSLSILNKTYSKTPIGHI